MITMGIFTFLESKEKREKIMKRKLTFQQYIAVVACCSAFWCAETLIFPVSMDQMAGRNVWPAILDF